MTNPIVTLSRERLEQLSSYEHVGSVLGHEIGDMARALLAVMDSKPFGYLFTGPAGTVVSPVDWPCEGMILQGPIWATPPAPSAPDGWKLVPVEPTPDMCEAMYRAKDKWPSMQCDNQREMHLSFAEPRYLAALAAAPAAPGGK